MDFFISIVIPVYNTEYYLRDCLNSIILQKTDDIQIICVNDGSTDNSLSILNEYKSKDMSINIISQKNQGLSVARNTGILNANGKYILFLDSDDMLKECALRTISYTLKSQDIDILLYDADCMYETENLKITDNKDNYYHRKKAYGGPKEGKLIFAEQIENDDICDSACLMAINREWMLNESLFFKPGMLYEDCLFTFQCFMLAKKVMHINSALMIYRVREHSIMTSKLKYKNLHDRMICYSELLKYLLNHDLSVRVGNAVEKFAELVMHNLKRIDFQLEIGEKDGREHFTCAEKLLSASMDVGIYGSLKASKQLLLLGFKERIKEAENIIIYGAGKIGKMVYSFLQMNHFQDKVTAFIVTSGAENTYINEIPVINVNEYFFSKKVLLLISANFSIQVDMLQTAYTNGFRDIEIVNRDLEEVIEADIKKQLIK